MLGLSEKHHFAAGADRVHSSTDERVAANGDDDCICSAAFGFSKDAFDDVFSSGVNGICEAETRGDGVVGEQPYLKPGQGFRYSTGAVIETPVGTMQGSYQMVADDGEQFDAPIAPFRLAMPGVLH